MAVEHTILFIVMPRGVSVDQEMLPVSVFVSPRLMGAETLGAFDDWLHWTPRLREEGLEFLVECAGHTRRVPIDREILRPRLWTALFHEDTLVRSHEFDDYSTRPILSFSVREALSALKAVYQDASLFLALPDTSGPQQERGDRNRRRLAAILDGLDIHWNSDLAGELRAETRRQAADRTDRAQGPWNGPLDAEGLITAQPGATALRQAAVPFAAFHHMPLPPRTELTIDPATIFDFHQALSALNAYPVLQRMLGLVFDLELPRDFVPETPLNRVGTLSIRDTSFAWQVPPRTPPLATHYIHVRIGPQRLFATAPHTAQQATPGHPVKPAPQGLQVLGLLDLDKQHFGLAQVDVDGGMHKAIILAETLNNPDPDRNLDLGARPAPAPHPEVFDPDATLPALRSGGLSLYADRRALQLLDIMQQSKHFNDAVKGGGAPEPFFAEDLVRGYRLDIWDSRTGDWHSLHLRNGRYQIGDETVTTEREEGFTQLAVTQPAPGATPVTQDLYLHEAVARWAGWSLSVPRPGQHLSRYADPADALPRDGEEAKFAEDQSETPFKLTAEYHVLPGSLPRLRFGVRYRIRARAVDLAGSGLLPDARDNPILEALSAAFGLPRDAGGIDGAEGFTYLRAEPVAAPLLVLRDKRAVTDPGSALDRLVIRTFNADISQDGDAADTSAADRHVVPPRTSAEMGERLGMFDDAAGKLKSDAATWQLIAERDRGRFPAVSIEVAGKTDEYPLEAGVRLDRLPYLPDPLAQGAALRDLPGTPDATIGQATPDGGVAGSVGYTPLSDPNPRPGSATLISFGDGGDWQDARGFRLALAEPPPGQPSPAPDWDPTGRVLTVYLPKGQLTVVPLTSYLATHNLQCMLIWQWLREYIEYVTTHEPQSQVLRPGTAVDEIAHVLQRAVEGGHWMLTPPPFAHARPCGPAAPRPAMVHHRAARLRSTARG